jgi:hypothetical protein
MSVVLGEDKNSAYGVISYRMCPRRDNEWIVGLQNSAVGRISKNTQSQSPETPVVSALASEETLVGLEL